MEHFSQTKTKKKIKLPPKQQGILNKLRYFFLTPILPPGIKDLYFYCVALRSCISAGVPITSAFKLLSESVNHRKLQKISFEISKAIDMGVPIEKILKSYEKTFSPFFINCFLAGLKSGAPTRTIQTLIDFYSFVLELRGKILKVVIYPLFQLTVGALIIATRDIIIASMQSSFDPVKAVSIIWMYLSYLLYAAGLAFIITRILKMKKVRPFTDEMITVIPIIGKLQKKYKLAIFFNTFSEMLETGANATYCLKIAIDAMDNHHLSRQLRRAEKFLRDGESFADSFFMTGALDSQCLTMINVGEQSASIPYLLRKMADYYTSETKTILPAIIKVIMPIFTIIVAVAFFVNVKFFFNGTFIMMLLIFLVY